VKKDLNKEKIIKAAKIIGRGAFCNSGNNFNSIKRIYVDK
jgi:hypothetical protein